MTVIAVVDTSVWVSAFLNPEGFPAHLIEVGKRGGFIIVSSLPLLNELQNVLLRPRIRRIRNLTDADIAHFIEGVANVARLVPVTGTLQLCRDPSDDVILETAILGRATHIVSRDEDMTRDLGLKATLRQQGIEVVTVQHLIDLCAVERLDE